MKTEAIKEDAIKTEAIKEEIIKRLNGASMFQKKEAERELLSLAAFIGLNLDIIDSTVFGFPRRKYSEKGSK